LGSERDRGKKIEVWEIKEDSEIDGCYSVEAFLIPPYPISPVANPQTSLLLSVKLQAEYQDLSLKKIYSYLFFYFLYCSFFIKEITKKRSLIFI